MRHYVAACLADAPRLPHVALLSMMAARAAQALAPHAASVSCQYCESGWRLSFLLVVTVFSPHVPLALVLKNEPQDCTDPRACRITAMLLRQVVESYGLPVVIFIIF